MGKLAKTPVIDLAPNRRNLAEQLGIPDAVEIAANDLVARIDAHLGDQARAEQARWYMLSVYRHVTKAAWHEPAQSGLSHAQQLEIARCCLALPEFVQSIKSVLKGDACKYALVEMRRTRNTAKCVLANNTVAFHCVARVLQDAQLLQNAQLQNQLQKSDAVEIATASTRRASRRGFSNELVNPGGKMSNNDPAAVLSLPKTSSPKVSLPETPDSQLSSQEYSELEQVLTRNQPAKSAPQSRQEFVSKETRSWMLGLVAGFAVCAVILLLLY